LFFHLKKERFIMFKHILFATDGSSASEHASQMAVNMARAHGSHLTVVYVIDPYPYMGGGEMNLVGFESYMESGRKHAERAFAHVNHLANIGGVTVQVKTRLVEDTSVVKAILKTAEEEHAKLIMLGSHGRGGLEKLLVGSVAAKIVAQSTKPVMVIR
jgi:nucleotide-binding universal stress UspA family protein